MYFKQYLACRVRSALVLSPANPNRSSLPQAQIIVKACASPRDSGLSRGLNVWRNLCRDKVWAVISYRAYLRNATIPRGANGGVPWITGSGGDFGTIVVLTTQYHKLDQVGKAAGDTLWPRYTGISSCLDTPAVRSNLQYSTHPSSPEQTSAQHGSSFCYRLQHSPSHYGKTA